MQSNTYIIKLNLLQQNSGLHVGLLGIVLIALANFLSNANWLLM